MQRNDNDKERYMHFDDDDLFDLIEMLLHKSLGALSALRELSKREKK